MYPAILIENRSFYFCFLSHFWLSAVAYYYFFSPKVQRSLVYGDQPRNR